MKFAVFRSESGSANGGPGESQEPTQIRPLSKDLTIHSGDTGLPLKTIALLILALLLEGTWVLAEPLTKLPEIKLPGKIQLDLRLETFKTPALKTLSDDEIARTLNRIGQEIQIRDRQMLQGGSDSGGGQGVFDRKTGRVRFLDLFTPEELRTMDLSTQPARDVFSQFPSCAKVSSTRFPMSRDLDAILDETDAVLNELSPSLDALKVRPWEPRHYLSRMSTSLKLRQLRDATSFPREYQVQLAIYDDGAAFFQEEALALMPHEDIKWLLVKESLRYLAKANKARVKNADVEEALRHLSRHEIEAFLGSRYVRELMRPRFELDDKRNLPLKKAYLRKAIASAELTEEERSLLAQDFADIEFFERVDALSLSERLKIQKPPELENRWDEYLRDEMEKGQEISREARRGFVPAWALQTGADPELYETISMSRAGNHGLITVSSEREAPGWQGFDVETGRRVWDLRGSCAPEPSR